MTEFGRWVLKLAQGGWGWIASVREHAAAEEPARVPVTQETHRVIVEIGRASCRERV